MTFTTHIRIATVLGTVALFAGALATDRGSPGLPSGRPTRGTQLLRPSTN